jgi:hypothetical protein
MMFQAIAALCAASQPVAPTLSSMLQHRIIHRAIFNNLDNRHSHLLSLY